MTRAAVARALASPRGRAGLALLGAVVALACVGPWLSPHGPNHSDFAAGVAPGGGPVGPSAAHPLGTDHLFRDELSRLAHAARFSLLVAISATAVSSAIAALVGTLAGWTAGTRLGAVDHAAMRLVDVLLSFPYLLLVMAIGAALDRTGALTVLLVLGATGWLGTARIVRAKTMALRGEGYVEAARALGGTAPYVLRAHVAPNVAGTLFALSVASVASMILAESVLSYLAVGVEPPTATLGRMLQEGQAALTLRPRLVALPGAVILASVLGFGLIGEALRDASSSEDRPA